MHLQQNSLQSGLLFSEALPFRKKEEGMRTRLPLNAEGESYLRTNALPVQACGYERKELCILSGS